MSEMEVSARIQVNYDINQQKIMELEKINVLNDIEVLKLKGTSVIYDNQQQCSLEIVAKLHNKKTINIMIVAKTQSGKTGAMIALIKNYLNDTTTLIPIENIYIITGLSSCEWVEQTKNRMPKSVQKRVFHRNQLAMKGGNKKKGINNFVDDIKNKKNVLVIIDEIQIAAKENQTLYKVFNQAGFYDKQNLLKKDIKIIEFTATPDGTIYDLMNWGDNASIIKMETGQNYTSCFDLKNNNRVIQYKDLCCYSKSTGKINEALVATNIVELKTNIDKFDEPKYHIVRIKNAPLDEYVISNFKKYIDEDMTYYTYDKESDIDDINNILKIKPQKNTYIFIKEKLRCAKTLHKTYLGVIYERYTKDPDDAVIIQGLIGRGTGYDDNGVSLYFTNKPSIEKYEKLWNSNFTDKSIKWKSKTTQRKRNLLTSKGTYNNPSLITGMGVSCDKNNEEIEPVIKQFKTQEEVKLYYKDELQSRFGGRGPMKRKSNKDGYYETVVGRKRGRGIYSCDEIHEVRKWSLNDTHKYTFHPCYDDINDKTTLQFWIIHY